MNETQKSFVLYFLRNTGLINTLVTQRGNDYLIAQSVNFTGFDNTRAFPSQEVAVNTLIDAVWTAYGKSGSAKVA